MLARGQFYAPATLPLGKSHGTLWIGGWMGPRAGWDAVAKIKIPLSFRSWYLVFQPVSYSLYWLS